MRARRNKLEIIAEILELATNGIKKTPLVHLSNINFNMLEKYLEPLMEKGFIENSGGLFYTTPVGYEFLNLYDSLKDALRNDDKKYYTEEMRATPHFSARRLRLRSFKD